MGNENKCNHKFYNGQSAIHTNEDGELVCQICGLVVSGTEMTPDYYQTTTGEANDTLPDGREPMKIIQETSEEVTEKTASLVDEVIQDQEKKEAEKEKIEEEAKEAAKEPEKPKAYTELYPYTIAVESFKNIKDVSDTHDFNQYWNDRIITMDIAHMGGFKCAAFIMFLLGFVLLYLTVYIVAIAAGFWTSSKFITIIFGLIAVFTWDLCTKSFSLSKCMRKYKLNRTREYGCRAHVISFIIVACSILSVVL